MNSNLLERYLNYRKFNKGIKHFDCADFKLFKI